MLEMEAWKHGFPQAQALASHRVRVAIQLSGHLRDVCQSDHFGFLLRAINGCNERAMCDVFLFTFNTLHPHLVESSQQCVEKMHREINLSDIRVEANIVPPHGSIRAAEGRVALSNGDAWFRSTEANHLLHPLPSYGIRSYIYAAASASTMRRSSNQVYDVAVRMRPDIYPQNDKYGSKEWLHIGSVPTWDVLVELVRHNSSLLADTIFSCTRLYVLLGETSVRVPGSKSNDNCFWSSDQTLDRAIRKWDTISVPFLVTNACRMQHERQMLLEHGNRSLARVRPMHDFLKGCDTYAVPHQWDVCSHLHGCLPEDILYIAINLTHLKARNLPAAA